MALIDDITAALYAGDFPAAQALLTQAQLNAVLDQILVSIRGGAIDVTVNDWSKIREFWNFVEPQQYSPVTVFPVAMQRFRSMIESETPPADPVEFFSLAAVICKAVR